MSNSQQMFCQDHKNQQITAICKIPRSNGKTKMCQKCLVNDRSIKEGDIIFINEFETEIESLKSALETIQNTQLQQLEILNEIHQSQDRLRQVILLMRQKKHSLDNFIQRSLSSLQIESINLSDNEVSDFMQLFNQQELLRSINLELQKSLNPLKDLRTRLNQQCEKILQDIQSINQILNEEESIFSENQQENQHQEHQNHDLNSYVSLANPESYYFSNSRAESPVAESFQKIIQNYQYQINESLFNTQMFVNSISSQIILKRQSGRELNENILINLNFDILANIFEVEVDPYLTIGELAQEFKIVLNHQKEIIFLYKNNILNEEKSLKQLNISNGFTLQGQLKY
ncbi:unnamed protein product (macronuclear) [Paramecium tetraurelia]|uniref:Ubiquitin-like domain-containing protein n=1 Tax=Paramecium tetraurelia TaxID=5888 RepID=A0CAK2_PARTE|nr:uncharacterized protein GSPATT00036599001 [Paramecium tetraurelia]CAK67819.1 unnamed protein product [Paramecium tetraurelia]|eukprot:XP_001435216.1 hypothetical protein (macronuclear) [Paramecium tetraurelia strain d4-2]